MDSSKSLSFVKRKLRKDEVSSEILPILLIHSYTSATPKANQITQATYTSNLQAREIPKCRPCFLIWADFDVIEWLTDGQDMSEEVFGVVAAPLMIR